VVGSTSVVASQNNCSNGANLESDMGAVMDVRCAAARCCVCGPGRARPAANILRMLHGPPSSTLKFYFAVRAALPHHSVLHQHNQNIGSDPFASSASLSHPEERYHSPTPRWFIISATSRHPSRKSKRRATSLTHCETYGQKSAVTTTLRPCPGLLPRSIVLIAGGVLSSRILFHSSGRVG